MANRKRPIDNQPTLFDDEPAPGAQDAKAETVNDIFRAIFDRQMVAFWKPHLRPKKALYHFTDAGGLVGILESRTLRASHFATLNDATEKEYGLSLASKLLGDIAAHDDKHGVFTLTRAMVAGKAAISNKLEEAVILAASSAISRRKAFVASLCKREDRSFHWMHYGKAGRGYALELQFAPNTSFEDSSKPAWAIRPILYEPKHQTQAIRRILQAFATVLDRLPVGSVDAGQAAVLLLVGLANLAVGMKDPSFRHEEEWRLFLLFATPDVKVKFRARGSMVVPFVDFSLETALHRVVVGNQLSKAHEETVYHAMRSYGFTPRVLRSKVPAQDPL